jgi:hypothetical protein
LTVLLERKINTEDDILKANEEQKEEQRKISDILVNMGRISRDRSDVHPLRGIRMPIP